MGLLQNIEAAFLSNDFWRVREYARMHSREQQQLPASLASRIEFLDREAAVQLIKVAPSTYITDLFTAALACLENEGCHSRNSVALAESYAKKHYKNHIAEALEEKRNPKPITEPFNSYYEENNALQQIPDNAGHSHNSPKISIILPVYKVRHEFLFSTITSVLRQAYRNWELCIYYCDETNRVNRLFLEIISDLDARIRLSIGNANNGISGNSNQCLNDATGEFIALLDHDDDITPNALLECAKAIKKDPSVDFIYTDKDCMLEDGNTLVNPLLKPDWSPEILYSANYLTHFNVIRKSLVEAVGGFDGATDGAQDWDLFFKTTEKANSIISLKKICYHWRIHDNSTSTGLAAKPYAQQAQELAINNHLNRTLGSHIKAVPNEHGGFRIVFDAQKGETAESHNALRIILHSKRDSTLATARETLPVIDQVETPIANQADLFDHLIESIDSPRFSQATSLIFANANLALTSNDLREISQWTSLHPEIGFCCGIMLDQEGTIKDYGLVYHQDTGIYGPLFAGQHIYGYGIFGSPLWYRNVQACSHNLVSLDLIACRKIMQDESTRKALASSAHPITELTILLSRTGFRGLVNPHCLARLEPDYSDITCSFSSGDFSSDLSGDIIDPFFHPALNTNLVLAVASDRDRESLAADSLLFLSPAPSQSDYFTDARVLAEVIDITPKELANNAQKPHLLKEGIADRTAVWLLPDFGSAFYGGIMTILRLANYLRKEDGVTSTFAICGNVNLEEKQAEITRAFPDLSNSAFIMLNGDQYQERLPFADYGIATLWTTAYILAASNKFACKYYMIQDHEPFFYPAGSTFAQADLTYRFGFFGIANTVSLAESYIDDYGGKATCLVPAVDTSVFFPLEDQPVTLPIRIFYYARPGTPRNCFELAAAAFKIVKQRYRSLVEILCAGAGWNPSHHGLSDVVVSLGMLPYEETADLYRSCHLGVSMMMTKHPSYLPLEMMACGTVVLANENPANTWLLKDNVNCLTFKPSKSCLADRISYAIENYNNLKEVRSNAINTVLEGHSSWEASLRRVSDFIHSAGD